MSALPPRLDIALDLAAQALRRYAADGRAILAAAAEIAEAS